MTNQLWKYCKVHSFIGPYILHMNIMCWKYIWHMDKCVDEWNMNIRMSECQTNFASSYKFVSNVFSMHDINAWNIQIMNEWILHISITKSWYVKFVMELT